MPRSSDPVFFPGTEKDHEISQMIESNYQDSITNLQEQWYQADLDQRTYLGDPDIWGVLYPVGYNVRKKMFNFNLTQASVMMVTGHQRRNRKSTITIPVLSPVQKTADQFTKCLYHVHKGNGYQVYSDAFEQGAIVQGFGLISIYPDFSTDPVSPEIKMRYVDFKSVIIDPWFRNKDLSDCRYIWTRQFFSKTEAMLYYKEFADEIADIPSQGFKDDKFYYMPENYNLQMKDILAFDEYWYLSQREATYVIDTVTEETKEIEGDEEDIRIVMMELGDKVRIVKKPKQTVRRCIRINNKVLIDEERPYGLDRYSYVGVYGNFNPDTQYFGYKFKGIVRDMRDAQFLYNIRKVTDLDILSSQQQGLKVKKGALLTPDDTLNRGNGRVLVINDKMDMNDVQPMEIIPPSPVMLQMEDMLKSVMKEITGINDELLGSAMDDKAGVLSMLRQGAGLTTLQKYFDQMDNTQRECGDIIIELIQNYWSYGKVKSVLGEEPTPEFDNKAFFKYGAKVIQGVLTESQQQLELGQLLNLREIMGENTPPPVYQRIIDAMYIQDKGELKEAIAQAQQEQAQQQQAQAQMQQQQMQVEMEVKKADANSKDGLAQERRAKIHTDMAVAEDKLKRAHTEDTASLLNVIKAIKELESMDLSQIAQRLELLQAIQPEADETPTAVQPQQPTEV